MAHPREDFPHIKDYKTRSFAESKVCNAIEDIEEDIQITYVIACHANGRFFAAVYLQPEQRDLSHYFVFRNIAVRF